MDLMEKFLNELLQINPNINIEMIKRAYLKAESYHEGQLRKSGEPYLVHPVEVAKILAELGMDENTIVAGLLHDTVEDTSYSQETLKADFGEEVAVLVDGVTKLGTLVYESKEERQAENLRKMFSLLAMSKDIRVLIIKLADRLHNLRTINYMDDDQIKEKCKETLEIYAPLASRLGIYTMKFELEDIALKQLGSRRVLRSGQPGKDQKSNREKKTSIKVIREIKDSLNELKIHYDITGRSKHFYSIYRKMKYQSKQLEEIFRPDGDPDHRGHRKRLLRRSRRSPHHVETDPGPLQGLHSNAEAQPVPVAAHYGDRRQRGTLRDPDPHL